MIKKNIFSLERKKIVVSGGAGLLGSSFCKAIINMGGCPIIFDKDNKANKKLDGELNKFKSEYYIIQADLNNENLINKKMKRLIKKIKKIDGLVNAAAFTMKDMSKYKGQVFNNFEDYKTDVWQNSIDKNLLNNFLLSKIVCKLMIKSGGGSIINIASDVGVISPDHRIYQANKKMKYKGVKFNTPITYSTTKAAIISMTKYLATFYANKGIRVNSISPAGVFNNQPKQFVNKLTELIPMGRMAKKHEIDGAVIFYFQMHQVLLQDIIYW